MHGGSGVTEVGSAHAHFNSIGMCGRVGGDTPCVVVHLITEPGHVSG